MPIVTRSQTDAKKTDTDGVKLNNENGAGESNPDEETSVEETHDERNSDNREKEKSTESPKKPKEETDLSTVKKVSNVSTFKPDELSTVINHVETFDGRIDARKWFHEVNATFMRLKLSLDSRLKSIPYLLEGDTFIWFSMNEEKFTSFTQFSKLFAQEYFSTIETAKTAKTEPTAMRTTMPLVHEHVRAEKTPTPAQSVMLPSSTLTSTIAKALVDKFVKDPLQFAGSKDNVSTWLEEIEQQFALMQLSDSDRLNLIHICLKHEALYWYRQNKHKFATWSIFIDEIAKAFQSRMKQDVNFEKLKRYRQTSHQSVTQYYLGMINLMKQADPEMNESTKVHYLINGLLPSLLIETRRNYPANSEEFLANAKVAEELTALHQSFTPVPVFGDEKSSMSSFHPNPHDFIDRHRQVDVNNHYARENYSTDDTQLRLISQIGKPTLSNSSQRDPPLNRTANDVSSRVQQHLHNNNPNRNFPRQQQSQEQVAWHCFKCGSPNHLARQCNHFQNRSQ